MFVDIGNCRAHSDQVTFRGRVGDGGDVGGGVFSFIGIGIFTLSGVFRPVVFTLEACYLLNLFQV